MLSIRMSAISTVLLLLMACSGSGGGDSGKESTVPAASRKPATSIANPCKLLTSAELSSALNAKYGEGELTTTFAGPRCRFFTAAQDEVYIDVDDPALFDAYAHSANQSVPEVGDQAFWEHTQYGSFLYVKKGGNVITVGLPRDVTKLTPALESMAKLAASRM